MKKFASSVVLGKFMPLHKGHQYMIDTARDHSRHLTILVCSTTRESIPGQLRYQWMKQTYPQQRVVHINDDSIPHWPHEHPHFWKIWTDLVRTNSPPDLQCIFSSEPYGKTLGDLLKIQHYDVDIQRTKVPISGTAIREKPLSNWDYISDAAKSFFVKKVVVMGPESAGKTTMCQRLAQKFRTVWVPEYGRELSEQKPDLELSDFPLIVERQIQSEEKLLSRANKLLFCDTECLTTMIFSRLYFPQTAHTIERFFQEAIEKYSSRYSLYLLVKPFGEGHQDGVRLFLDKREEHYRTIKHELQSRGLPIVILDGNTYDENFDAASRAVEQHILNTF